MQKNNAALSIHTGGVDPLGTDNLADRIEMILKLTRELSGLIDAETTLLKHRRPLELNLTEEKKTHLSILYAREMRAIQTRPELLRGATATQKQALRTAAENFKNTVVQHTRRLVHTRAVTESLIVAVGEEWNRRRNPATRYGPPNRHNAAKNSVKTCPAAYAFSHDKSI